MNHLLIVEDDRALGEGVRLALQGPALEVKLCHCLADARVLLKEQSFDLIVLDINLPDGSGLTFLQQLRQGGGPPIILLTEMCIRDRCWSAWATRPSPKIPNCTSSPRKCNPMGEEPVERPALAAPGLSGVQWFAQTNND